MTATLTQISDHEWRCSLCGAVSSAPRHFLCGATIAQKRETLAKRLPDLHAKCRAANLRGIDSVGEAMKVVGQHCAVCNQFTGDGCRKYSGCKEIKRYQMAYGVTTSYPLRLLGILPPCEKWRTAHQKGDSPAFASQRAGQSLAPNP